MNALGLIVNMIVLRNTRYMEGVLMRLRSEGYRVWPKEGGGRRRRRKNIKILARRVGVRRAWRATPVVHRD
ncbi:MAG: Tn3 family transposase [Thiomonas arsenitoxydans]|uniref:Tn3 family transposase n=1 Tax=Thiomonas arsenitoxydans (strain DSM 22701 / CIP 110005 / 3As) TaxID=426114 RepID=A0A8I1MU49_THIA3|nr:Tn3 family transposase [Thiomonas arsenitoxydans]